MNNIEELELGGDENGQLINEHGTISQELSGSCYRMQGKPVLKDMMQKNKGSNLR